MFPDFTAIVYKRTYKFYILHFCAAKITNMTTGRNFESLNYLTMLFQTQRLCAIECYGKMILVSKWAFGRKRSDPSSMYYNWLRNERLRKTTNNLSLKMTVFVMLLRVVWKKFTDVSEVFW
jgi:hypothetical protein